MSERDTPSSCLFVSDLPNDITEKELERLFAGCHGFDSCRVRKDKNEHDVGFVDFRDPDSATIAKERFKGHELRGHVIAVCYARGRKRPRTDRTEPRENGGHHRTPSGGGVTALAGVNHGYLGMAAGMAGMGGMHAAQAYGMATPRMMQMSAMGLPLRLPNEAHHTLYVEGIPSDASEREMAHIFRPFPGYISLRLRAKGGRGMGPSSFNSDAICFVEFESAYHATIAKMGVADYRLDKLDRNTAVLRIEYAKPKGSGRDRGSDRDRF